MRLAAGYDTTSHTLAWTAWHLAVHPQWRDPQLLPLFLDEILRRYPACWLGSRVASEDSTAAGVQIPAGALVLYSRYLTHQDPSLWDDPHLIQPQRLASGRPGWSYLPFAAGPRTCLGAHLARLILRTALAPLCRGNLAQAGGDPTVMTGITLRPRGPLRRRPDDPPSMTSNASATRSRGQAIVGKDGDARRVFALAAMEQHVMAQVVTAGALHRRSRRECHPSWHTWLSGQPPGSRMGAG